MNQELRLPERGPQCPPAVVLEYLAAGEAIDPAQSAHVGGCSQCSAYVQALSEACSEFQRAHPDELVLRKLARRREATPTRRSWLGGLLAGFAATAALVLAVVLVLPNQGVRHKGGTEFGVYVQRQGESAPAPLASGARVYAGDVLRFHVRA
ncbi:MAG: hypothetical protein HY901_30445, partial [Deltaproteobacteria bacterium]|nr:hypothetical protein [Deltaproteobacteria bacterium]